MSKDISENEKIILTGRIYPAIQSCVANRYKIIVGYFALVGYLLINEKVLQKFYKNYAVSLLACVFAAFILVNFLNYWLNAIQQWKIEGINKKFPLIEGLSSCVMLLLVIGGYFVLRKFACSA